MSKRQSTLATLDSWTTKIFKTLLGCSAGVTVAGVVLVTVALFMPRWFELEEGSTKIYVTMFGLLEMIGIGVQIDNPILFFHGLILVVTWVVTVGAAVKALYVMAHHTYNRSEDVKNFTSVSVYRFLAGVIFGIVMNDLHEKEVFGNGKAPLDITEHVTTSGKLMFAGWLCLIAPTLVDFLFVLFTDTWKILGKGKSKSSSA